MNAIPLTQSASYYENSKRAGKFTPCAICGRAIKNENTAYWIRLNVSNEVIPMDAEIDPADDMGAFPVGKDCYSKHPELNGLATNA